MGEVYRAHDARLSRDVAIKVLPSAFAHEPMRLGRFAQEAKAAAALNDPNIVAVFDVGIGNQPYVVSELLEGRTLRQALSAGALPPKTAVDIAIQIASGIAAAHQKGIVHRDLKPENIFLTTRGLAKILDFGLAKLTQPESALAVSSASTTLPATLPGAILGTVGYMSPEQVRGDDTDHRSDIFALGAVLYEMLSGRRAFARPTAPETMTAILNDDPPELARNIHGMERATDRIVRRCLEKDPHQRFQAARDIAFALEAISGASSGQAAVVAPVTSRWPMRAAVIAAAAIGIAIGAVGLRPAANPSSPAVRFQAMTFDRRPVTNARFMPDGSAIVFSAAARRGSSPNLFVINPNAEGPQPLGISDAHLLSVSSKGELAIIADARHLAQRVYRGTLARMTIGSSPRPMLDNVREADWSPDGDSLAIVRDLGTGRDRLEYPVGTALHEASGYLSDPRVSPDGGRVAFFEHQWRFDDRGWVVVADRSGRITRLTGEYWGVQGLAWSPDGSSVIFSGNSTGGSLMQPFSIPVAGGVAQPVFGVPGRFIVLDIARDGRWLGSREELSFDVRARVPGQSGERDLSWLGSAGARTLSHDGEWLLLVDVGPSGGKNYGVVMRKTDGSRTMRLGEGEAQSLSPDGRSALAIVASPPQLVIYPVGTGDAIRVVSRTIERYVSAEWFPDGKRLFVCGSELGHSVRCYEQDLGGSMPTPVTQEGVRASLAPDGQRLLLLMPDGSFQLSEVRGRGPRPAAGMRSGDRQIAWSRDSGAVFVQSGPDIPATIERVNLTTGERTVTHKIVPEDPSAASSLAVTDWIEDGPWYAYNLTRLASALFVVTGATPAP